MRPTSAFPALSLLAAVATAVQAGPPVRPGVQWQPVPQFTDDFNAPAVDAAKWTLTCGTWLGREPGMFSDNNVATKDGAAQFSLKAEQPPKQVQGYSDYTCGVLRSRHRIRYGYFEIRAKAGRSRGSSAFWFYSDTPQLWTEIDVFEISAGHPEWGDRIHMDAPVLRYPGVQGELHFREIWQAPWNPADDWHVYAMEWDAEALRWYVDGTMIRQLPNTHWQQALHLVLDTETMPGWFGLPDKNTLPATFSVDYVHAWQKAAAPGAVAAQKAAAQKTPAAPASATPGAAAKPAESKPAAARTAPPAATAPAPATDRPTSSVVIKAPPGSPAESAPGQKAPPRR